MTLHETIEQQAKTNNSRMLNKLMAVLLGAGIGILLLFAYVILWPVEVIRPNVQPYKVITHKVVIGGDLVYQVDSCKLKEVKGDITRTFAGSVRYPSTSSLGTVKTGCAKTNVSVPVPAYIPTGKFHLEIDAVYKVYGFRDVVYHFTTEEFTVENPIIEKIKNKEL